MVQWVGSARVQVQVYLGQRHSRGLRSKLHMTGVWGLPWHSAKTTSLRGLRTGARGTLRCTQCTAASSAALSEHGAPREPHTPVLLNEILGFLRDRHLNVYVDGTLGAGGHASAILSEHQELKSVVGFDVDPLAHTLGGDKLRACAPPNLDLHLVKANFREMTQQLAAVSPGLEQGGVDAILIDFGVSSMQLDLPERGFSFLSDGPVDMRMDPEATLRAEQVVNDWPESELGRILRDYGEERMWRQIAARICNARPITTNAELVRAIGRGKAKKGKKEIHPATRTFQAIRIAVNDELSAIEEVLPAAIKALAPGGRLGVISFHSLEDRLVKQAFREAAGMKKADDDFSPHARYLYTLPEEEPEKVVKILTKRPVIATDEETAINPRSRSAKLRFVEKL